MVERAPTAIKGQAIKYQDLKDEMDRLLESFGRASSEPTDNEDDDGMDDEENSDDDDEDEDEGGVYHD